MTEQELFDWCIETGKARGAELRLEEVPDDMLEAMQADPELRVQAGALLYAASMPKGATDSEMVRARPSRCSPSWSACGALAG